MDEFRRNRAVLSIVLALAVLAAFVVQYYGVFDIKFAIWPKDDSPALLEKSGVVDVIYFGVGAYESNLLNKTPVFALGVIYYPPEPLRVDAEYHIELTSGGWNIVEGRYDWSPDLEEPQRDEIRKWNFRKLYHYEKSALFKPGESERVFEAMAYLLDYVGKKVFREWLYTVFVVAEQQEAEWSVIEIDFVKPTGFESPENPTMLFGYTEDTGATYVMAMWPDLLGTLRIFRTQIKGIVDAGKLTDEALIGLRETGQMWMEPFPQRYAKGFNHPWQGRELEGKT